MFQQQPRPADSAGKGSVFYQGVSALGTAIGIGAAILGTPPLFNAWRGDLYVYLAKTWGAELAYFLTFAFGCVEAFILYAGVKLLFTSLVIWGMAALAAKRFPSA